MSNINVVQSFWNFAQLNKIKKQASSQNLKSLTQKTKKWCNYVFSKRFGRYSFQHGEPSYISIFFVQPKVLASKFPTCTSFVSFDWSSLLPELSFSNPLINDDNFAVPRRAWIFIVKGASTTFWVHNTFLNWKHPCIHMELLTEDANNYAKA